MTEKEYNKCVDLYSDNLFRFIIKNLDHAEDARDVVQNSFEILWKHCQDVPFEKAKSYLFTVGYHNMIDHVRKVKRITLVDQFKEEEKVAEHKISNAKEVIDKALARLSEVQRSLILLKDYEGYSYEEIGQMMDLNPSQVKVYLHRARIHLKNYLVKMENVI
ncbi:RNA polymerase sigma-70 factor, ECF subfamily [Chitinophaga terrae (ex Kim and Jung 2007)]|jgi:RNA polymerase sigma-70 factor (ECF subfamily)|uniref:RNA polymerase sigma-70 factor, ECF subfamily n=1 Tax=Chitinophaga terrae (ex Kim and Jung 2007) TaxID=408074 RepID=A0A1H4G6T9_9BACT|nr:RNA polymerase sigma factor [Chitinophaga terrae (ex Kim and Jung 2007)]MDQ0105616.1 RNA polymerase sigma-70 factor (ECF subfamily) [Chitinophaga terrae (ex Kim and Jung 2007)]GEP93095.1 RNA polymerase [Chitinophaga terrae (ex Kim and Jung 2007)]SEB05157.1 RNA polymerase sigma-70 factor, ECF subfamily [Chitinophaga terrae (ex Kim and Jung 2007)]